MTANSKAPSSIKIGTVDDGEQNTTISNTTIDIETSVFSSVIKFELDIPPGELASTPLVNSKEYDHFPKNVILSAVSSTTIQVELVRPILAGTYNGLPAYLLQFQFFFQVVPSGWSRRIKNAIIDIVFEGAKDATNSDEEDDWDDTEESAEHPIVVERFPAGGGWKGPVKTKTIGHEVGVGAGVKETVTNASIGLNYKHNTSHEREGEVHIQTIRSGGPARNILRITMTENPISCTGIPTFVQLPAVIRHLSTRFQMSVTVKATCGFWHSSFTKSVPVVGKLDNPSFFDPKELEAMMKRKARGKDGNRVVEQCGELVGINLQEYSSLAGDVV